MLFWFRLFVSVSSSWFLLRLSIVSVSLHVALPLVLSLFIWLSRFLWPSPAVLNGPLALSLFLHGSISVMLFCICLLACLFSILSHGIGQQLPILRQRNGNENCSLVGRWQDALLGNQPQLQQLSVKVPPSQHLISVDYKCRKGLHVRLKSFKESSTESYLLSSHRDHWIARNRQMPMSGTHVN